MAMHLPASLSNLTTREAIADAIYRITEAYDLNNFDMFTSATTSDVTIDFNGQTLSGRDTIRAYNFNTIAALDTLHYATNLRINVANDAATTAIATANALAQHYPTGKGTSDDERRFLAGVRYYVDLIKDETDGLWKIKKFTLKAIWREGDQSVMHPQK